jgi:hypothetical protein
MRYARADASHAVSTDAILFAPCLLGQDYTVDISFSSMLAFELFPCFSQVFGVHRREIDVHGSSVTGLPDVEE